MSWDDQHDEPATSPFAGVLAGLAVMLVAALLSLAGIGAGHGWMRPIMVTMFLFPIWPVGFWLPQRRPVPPSWKDVTAGLLVLVGAGLACWTLYSGNFHEWTYGQNRPVGLPWFGMILFAGAALAGIGWSLRAGRKRLVLPVLLLGIGLLVDLGLVWQAKYGPGTWGYNSNPADDLWFVTWASWQVMVLWALLREWHRYERDAWTIDEADDA